MVLIQSLRHGVLLLALALSLAPGPRARAAEPQPAPVANAPKGNLVIIGGALRDDTAPVWERIVQLAGGKGARIAVIPAAAGNPTRSGATIARYLNRYGADAFVLPVAPRLPGDVRKAANDPGNAAAVRAAGGVYFAGGDQGRITQALRNPDGSNTQVLDAVWELYRRGGVIAGTSAGAAVMSKDMFYEAKPVLAMLQRGVTDGQDIAAGLGFIGDDIFVDQHLLIRGRFARMLPVMLKKGYRLGLGVDENTAVVIKPEREAEVIGYKGVLVVDLGQATTDRKQTAFNISNASISYLDKGDRLKLGAQVFLPSADKIDGRVDPADPSYREPLYSADILGNTTLVDLMEKLIDSDQKHAIGLAFEGPRDQPGVSPVGFEFRFSRTPDSAGYSSASSAAYSIYRVRLDVRPIKLGWPSYQYH